MKRTMRALAHAVGTAAALSLAGPVAAQKVAPGLWEYGMTMKGAAGGQMDAAMAQMKEQMARMPPEQRKTMEETLSRQGVALGGAGKPTTAQVCITPEQAARDDVMQQPGDPNSQCTQTSKVRSGNTLRFRFACSGDKPTSGEGEFTFVSDKEHRGRMLVDTTLKGKPERLEMDTTGRWLGADCGAIKSRR